MKARNDYGRNNDLTALAWTDYSSNNIEYRTFSISQQCEIETNLICNQSKKPKIFYKYIRRKKKGKPPVGPLKIENRVISDPQEMSEVFVRSFSSVFSTVLPQVIIPHQESETEMRKIRLTIEKVFFQLNKLDETSAPGSDGVNHKLLKSCVATLSYPLFLIYIKSLREGKLSLV